MPFCCSAVFLLLSKFRASCTLFIGEQWFPLPPEGSSPFAFHKHPDRVLPTVVRPTLSSLHLAFLRIFFSRCIHDVKHSFCFLYSKLSISWRPFYQWTGCKSCFHMSLAWRKQSLSPRPYMLKKRWPWTIRHLQKNIKKLDPLSFTVFAATVDEEIVWGIGRANARLGEADNTTKIRGRLYEACVQSSLFYVSESWTSDKIQGMKLFHLHNLCKSFA